VCDRLPYRIELNDQAKPWRTNNNLTKPTAT
jgi:hypothetical protein